MRDRFVLLAAGVIAAGVSVVQAQTIYSNVDNVVSDPRAGGVVMRGQNGEVLLNEVTTVGGGGLQSITFSAGVPAVGPIGPNPLFSDATVFIYTDEGDDNPDNNGDGIPDAGQLLFQSASISLPGVLQGNYILHTIDVSGSGVVVPDNSTLWVGVQFSDSGFGEVEFSPPTTGSTSGALWTPLGLSSVSAGTGVGFEITVPAPGGAAALGLLGLAGIRRRRR